MTVLSELESAFTSQDRLAARSASQRMLELLKTSPSSHLHRDEFTALVAYGGGKDSSHMLAVSRYMQAYLAHAHSVRINLRVVTNRHPGMPREVMANIDRVYKALSLYDDPQAELLLIDGEAVTPFTLDAPLPTSVVEASRQNILMGGHRCYGSGRPTFCNGCNASMVSGIVRGMGYGEPVSVVLTGDSQEEQRAYVTWLLRLGRHRSIGTIKSKGFDRVAQLTAELSRWYGTEVHGHERSALFPGQETRRLPQSEGVPFFSVYGDANYSAESHWDFLTSHLGFQFDEFAFNFTETDCANPALMAHIRGLRSERVYGTGYATGVQEYVNFATSLMREKEFPEFLISAMRERYGSSAAVTAARRRMENYALSAYGLTTSNLVCMVFSPFASQGYHLHRYLVSQAPSLLPHERDIVEILSRGSDDHHGYVGELQRLAGLDMPQLRHLYEAELAWGRGDAGIADTAVGRVLLGDPHKIQVVVEDAVEEEVTDDIISGR